MRITDLASLEDNSPEEDWVWLFKIPRQADYCAFCFQRADISGSSGGFEPPSESEFPYGIILRNFETDQELVSLSGPFTFVFSFLIYPERIEKILGTKIRASKARSLCSRTFR